MMNYPVLSDGTLFLDRNSLFVRSHRYHFFKRARERNNNNFLLNLLNSTLRVPVGQSGQKWAHSSSLALGYIVVPRKVSISCLHKIKGHSFPLCSLSISNCTHNVTQVMLHAFKKLHMYTTDVIN